MIKNLREGKPNVKRVLYLAKLNEQEMKGEVEKEFTNYFKAAAEDDDFGGINLIVGSLSIHLLECEPKTMLKILRKVSETAGQPNSGYSQIWLLHSTEGCPE